MPSMLGREAAFGYLAVQTLLSRQALFIGFSLGALFHFVNACRFGLNRFFWFWLAAYPSLLWL